MIKSNGEVDFLDESLTANGRAVVQRKKMRVRLGGRMVDIFPPCPKCEKGYLIPFSRGQDIFELWKCTNCAYTLNKR